MSSRRIVYLTALAMGAVFHSLYGQYLSYILLRFLILLPFVSLLISLPAMLRVRVHLSASGASPRGDGSAAITPEEQQQTAADAIEAWIS